jgi:hypothetical protein
VKGEFAVDTLRLCGVMDRDRCWSLKGLMFCMPRVEWPE